MTETRRELITRIIADLIALRDCDPNGPDVYAINCNIRMFQSMHSKWRLIRWAMLEMGKIDSSRILELTDLETTHRNQWECLLHDGLRWLDHHPHAGRHARQIQKKVMAYRGRFCQSHRRFTVLSLGCGCMELGHQILCQLSENPTTNQREGCLFIGVDMSGSVLDAVEKSLHGIQGLRIKRVTNLDRILLKQLQKTNGQNGYHQVVLCQADAVKTVCNIDERLIDVAYHRRFRHHLTHDNALQMEEGLRHCTKIVIEMDGIQKKFIPLLLSMFATWSQPILINGFLFSNLRYQTHKQLKKRVLQDAHTQWKLGTIEYYFTWEYDREKSS